MKRILPLLLCLLLTGSAAAAAAPPDADEVFPPSSPELFSYEEDGLGGLTVVNCTAQDATVTVPSAYRGKPVTSIGDMAFFYLENLETLVIPDSVLSVGGQIVFGVPRLRRILLSGDSPAFSVRAGALYSRDGKILFLCPPGAEALDFPPGLNIIGEAALAGTGFHSLTLPGGVREIGVNAFEGAALREINLPEGLESIDDWAFSECANLTSIRIPASVNRIGELPFSECLSLGEIRVDPGSRHFRSLDGVLFSADGSVLLAYPAGRPQSSYTVPAQVRQLGSYAFSDSFLEEITLPEALKDISDSAFTNCASLRTLFLPGQVSQLSRYSFYGCDALTGITVDESNHYYFSGDGALFDRMQQAMILLPRNHPAEQFRVPDGVLRVLSDAFSKNENLREVFLPSGLLEIENRAFYFCRELTAVHVPDSVTRIEPDAFMGCDAVTLHGAPGSLAQRFARERGIPFVEEPPRETPAGPAPVAP